MITPFWQSSAGMLPETVTARLTLGLFGGWVRTGASSVAVSGDRCCVHAGKAQADAAAGCKVKVFVFSTLEDVDKRSQVRGRPAQRFVEHVASSGQGHSGGL